MKRFSAPSSELRAYNFMAGATAGLAESPAHFEKKKEDGESILRIFDMPVFRSGTFRDSWGEQTTWEPEHMKAMVDNYSALASRQILESAPVRDGHPAIFSGLTPGAGAVVGWHTEIKTKELKAKDGVTYTYVLADYEVTEPDAVGKIDRKTWRNRSAEIGTYRTNNEAEYWPAYMGFAYVDLPAVELLNGHNNAFSKESPNRFFISSVAIPKATEPVEGAPVGDENKTGDQTPATQPAAPAAQAPTQVHAAPAPSFVVFGKSTTDIGAVQAHINTLELFQRESREKARKDFVSSLATSNKILAKDVDAQTAFALSLSDEQYGKWTEMYSAAPSVPGIGSEPQGQSPTTPEPTGTPDPKATRIAELQGTLRMHSAAGASKEDIEKMASYQELQSLLAAAK